MTLATYGDAPRHDDDVTHDLIEHAQLRGGEVASDTPGPALGAGTIELCLGGTDAPRMRSTFEALAQGGTVRTPLE